MFGWNTSHYRTIPFSSVQLIVFLSLEIHFINFEMHLRSDYGLYSLLLRFDFLRGINGFRNFYFRFFAHRFTWIRCTPKKNIISMRHHSIRSSIQILWSRKKSENWNQWRCKWMKCTMQHRAHLSVVRLLWFMINKSNTQKKKSLRIVFIFDIQCSWWFDVRSLICALRIQINHQIPIL